MRNGVVVKALNGYYYVQDGSSVTQCKVRGRFKKERFLLTVGDRVDYVPLGGGDGVIEAIAPRRSLLRRPPVANVDQVILTFAAAQPDLHPLLLDRFLVLAEHAGLEAVVCINKEDLADWAALDELVSLYRGLGYAVLCVSACPPSGLEALRERLRGKVSAFAGPSGVGKSTLLNALDPGLRLTTGSISDKIRRGRHTTRVAELLPFPGGGFVVDTPGFSFTEFDHIEPRELAGCFPEFREAARLCRYHTCLHSREPQCAVKQAVEEGRAAGRRYESYLNILHEIQSKKKEF